MTYNKLFSNTKVDGLCDICGSSDFESRIDDIEATVTRKSVAWDAAGKFTAEFKPHPLVDEIDDRVRQLELQIVKQQKDIEYLTKSK